MSTAQRIGGSFAPPLTDEALAAYEALINKTPRALREALTELLTCVKKWWALPVSRSKGKPHPSGRGTVIALEANIAADLEQLIPWKHEIAAIQGLCDEIPENQRELRHAAFHLLWHVKELDLDREPITNDLLAE